MPIKVKFIRFTPLTVKLIQYLTLLVVILRGGGWERRIAIQSQQIPRVVVATGIIKFVSTTTTVLTEVLGVVVGNKSN